MTVAGDNIKGEVGNVYQTESAITKLEIIHECLGGEVSANGISVTELVDPCVFNGVNNEYKTAVFGGFVELEIVP